MPKHRSNAYSINQTKLLLAPPLCFVLMTRHVLLAGPGQYDHAPVSCDTAFAFGQEQQRPLSPTQIEKR
jgi:hypothetical protein